MLTINVTIAEDRAAIHLRCTAPPQEVTPAEAAAAEILKKHIGEAAKEIATRTKGILLERNPGHSGN